MELQLNHPIPFGKHKGELIKDIIIADTAYMIWVLNTIKTYTYSQDIYNTTIITYLLRLSKVQDWNINKEWIKNIDNTEWDHFKD